MVSPESPTRTSFPAVAEPHTTGTAGGVNPLTALV
jgi:hypothetical protein